jgi:hypothetical protein
MVAPNLMNSQFFLRKIAIYSIFSLPSYPQHVGSWGRIHIKGLAPGFSRRAQRAQRADYRGTGMYCSGSVVVTVPSSLISGDILQVIHIYPYAAICYLIRTCSLYFYTSLPRGSMYGIYANIGDILMVNATIYTIHGSYGLYRKQPATSVPSLRQTQPLVSGYRHQRQMGFKGQVAGALLGRRERFTVL